MLHSNRKKERKRSTFYVSRNISHIDMEYSSKKEEFVKAKGSEERSDFRVGSMLSSERSANVLQNKLPRNMDETRLLVQNAPLAKPCSSLLAKIEVMHGPIFPRLHSNKHTQRRVPEEHSSSADRINLSNCGMSLVNWGKVSRNKHEMQLLNDWLKETSAQLHQGQLTPEVFCDIRDVLLLCALELRSNLGKYCSVRADLFGEIYTQMLNLNERVNQHVLAFLDTVDQLNLRQAQELEERKERIIKEYIHTQEHNTKKISRLEEANLELGRMIRQQNLRLGNAQYAMKQLRSDLGLVEEMNNVLNKENVQITKLLFETVHDLNSKLGFTLKDDSMTHEQLVEMVRGRFKQLEGLSEYYFVVKDQLKERRRKGAMQDRTNKRSNFDSELYENLR